jgi:hypothetical protein
MIGGALAELDSLYLTLNLPSGTKISGVTYGTPRVGNSAWSSFFDSKVGNFTRVNHANDLIPILPFISWGFEHVADEVHITSNNNAVLCPGLPLPYTYSLRFIDISMCPGAEDLTDAPCTDQQVFTIFDGDVRIFPFSVL